MKSGRGEATNSYGIIDWFNSKLKFLLQYSFSTTEKYSKKIVPHSFIIHYIFASFCLIEYLCEMGKGLH